MLDIVARIRKQHEAAVEDAVARHIVWSPRLVPVSSETGRVVTVLELNDGRTIDVITNIVVDG